MRPHVCNWWIGFLKATMADLCTLTPWGPVQSRICQWRLTGCCMSAHLAEQGTQMAWQHPPVQRRTRSVHIHIQLSISIKLMPFTLEEHVSSQTSLTMTGFTQKLWNANECGFNMIIFFFYIYINWKISTGNIRHYSFNTSRTISV